MLRGAEMRVYASMSARIMEMIRPELEDALKRGLKVVLITEPAFHMEGAIVWHSEKKTAADPPDRGLLLRADRRPLRRGIFHLPLLTQEKPYGSYLRKI